MLVTNVELDTGGKLLQRQRQRGREFLANEPVDILPLEGARRRRLVVGRGLCRGIDQDRVLMEQRDQKLLALRIPADICRAWHILDD